MKVLIVDDEAMICEWLQFCILQNPHCQLTGIAHNGLEALELFHQEEPDLILSDIKMPVMDGLELLHELRALNSRVKVVMLTAFADFDLVRQALREGASEYLLKTEMENEILQELLNRTAGELQVSHGQGEDDIANMSQVYSVIRKILRQEKELSDDDLERLRQCGMRWRNNGLFALTVWKQSILNKGLVFPKDTQARHVAGLDYTDRIYMVIGNFPRTLSISEKVQQLKDYAGQVQKMNSCMVGISAVTDEMRQIPFMAWQAACSLAEGFYAGEKRLYEPQCTLDELHTKSQCWKRILAEQRVRLYQTQGVQRYDLIEAFLEEASHKRILAVESLCKLCVDAFDLLEYEAREHGTVPENAETLRTQLMQSVSVEEASGILCLIARQCRPVSAQQAPKSKSIKLAVEYIHANYGEQLNLEQVAARVYLTPEYFSRAFKEEMGQTFVNYLTDVRLQHSVHLLETTALRVQNIAQMVGYYNASYFSTTFKKKYGMSPYEYRRKGV